MNTPLPPATVSTRPHLLSRLQREWERLSVSRSALRTARSWDLPVDRFESLDELLRHLGYGRLQSVGSHDDDGVLTELLLLARTDELAARVVLQRMLPGLVSITRRRAERATNGLAEFDDVLTTAWTVIRCYPLDRRPGYIAANLLRDVDYHVFRRPYRRIGKFVPTPNETFERSAAAVEALPEDDPQAELADLLQLAARSGMDPDDVELARRLGAGASTAELAAECNVTDRTIRNRRAALVRRLQAVATQASAIEDATKGEALAAA